MTWKLLRLSDGAYSVRADGVEVWGLKSLSVVQRLTDFSHPSDSRKRENAERGIASDIEQMLRKIPVITCTE